MRHDTVITTFVRIIDFSENMYLGQSRSNLKDMANEALKAAGRAYAFEELQKALKNNRANMYENTEHVRKDKSMTAEEFLDVFDERELYEKIDLYGKGRAEDYKKLMEY